MGNSAATARPTLFLLLSVSLPAGEALQKAKRRRQSNTFVAHRPLRLTSRGSASFSSDGFVQQVHVAGVLTVSITEASTSVLGTWPERIRLGTSRYS